MAISCNPVQDLANIVKSAATDGTKITLIGAGKGTSGKTTSIATTVVDLNNLNKILSLDTANKTITVQAGITWKELQEYINNYGLSLAAMQSYSDFSVGGSIGVNAHGQDFRFAPVGSTIISMNMINATGQEITLSNTQNSELFHAVIGGYGLFGIITQVTLQLTDNTILKKRVKTIDAKKINALTAATLANKNIALFSGRFDIGAADYFDKILTITYYDTPHRTTEILKSLSSTKKMLSRSLLNVMREKNSSKNWRFFIEKTFIEKDGIHSRNNAMYNFIDHLKSNKNYIDILQEYFIPLHNVQDFIKKAKIILKNNQVNLLNCTLRFVKQDNTSFLNYAQCDCAALVLYIALDNNQVSLDAAQPWTQELIDAAISCGGTFYLPYQCFATREQVRQAYPQWEEFIALKNKYDPQGIFVNDLYLNYK